MNYEQSAKTQTERLMADGHATILAIESSCDETAAAIVRDGRQVISSVISSQIPLHAMYGGVVPEIASRAHVESVDPVVDEALKKAGMTLSDVDAVAVTYGPGLVGALYEAGIVMNDVRYTNFDVRVYWKTQAFQYTNFHDVPEGVADKITIFPEPEQWNELRALIPPDFDISISEGVMWMLMNPQANKEHALHLLCERLDVPLEQTAAFGDDLIDINMMSESGRGVAVANANPKVLSIADEICPSNNEDGVAQWIEAQLG